MIYESTSKPALRKSHLIKKVSIEGEGFDIESYESKIVYNEGLNAKLFTYYL